MKNLDTMLFEAKTKYLERDKERTSAKSSKKYQILAFPAYCGSPLYTNYYLIALAISLYRGLFYPEVRIEKNENHKFYKKPI